MPNPETALRKIWWRCAAVWFCIAAALTFNFYWGAGDGWRDLDIARHREWADATVTALQANKWDFEYQFKVSGQTYTGSDRSDFPERYEIGDHVDISYSTTNPSHSTWGPLQTFLPTGVFVWGLCAIFTPFTYLWRRDRYLSSIGHPLPQPFFLRPLPLTLFAWFIIAEGVMVTHGIDDLDIALHDARTTGVVVDNPAGFRELTYYTYQGEGRPYTGTRSAGFEKAGYPPGTTFEIHYSTANPGNSTVGWPWTFAVQIACGWLVFSIVLYFVRLRQSPRRLESQMPTIS